MSALLSSLRKDFEDFLVTAPSDDPHRARVEAALVALKALLREN